MTTAFSDYIVYVDESGDHSLESINPEYPLFVLSFCIFRKDAYACTMTPAVRKLLGEKPDLMPYAASVMYGSSFAMRTMVNMMIRAQELLGVTGKTRFTMVATEEDAKAWIAQQREADRAKKTS